MRKKVVQLVSGNILNSFLKGILTIYVARVLGPANQGILALAMGAALVFSMLLDFGIPHAIAYFIRYKPTSAQKSLFYLNNTLLCGFFISIGSIFLGKDFFSSVFLDGNKIDSFIIFLLIGITLVNSNNTMIGAGVISKGDAKKYAFSINAGTVTILLITLLMVNFTSLVIHGVLLAYLIGYAVTAVMLRIVFSEYIKFYNTYKENVLSWKEFFGFGWKAQIGSVASFSFKRMDLFIVGYFLNTSAVGYYSVGLSLRDIALILPRAMAGLIGGEMADQNSKISGAGIRLLKKGILFNLAFSIMVLITSILILPFAILFVFGSAYKDAILPSIIIMGSLIPLSTAIITAVGLPAYGKPMHMSVGTVISSSFGLVIIWYLTNLFGLIGTALSSILACTILSVAHISLFWFFVIHNSNHKDQILLKGVAK